MRIKYTTSKGTQFGEFVGLIVNDEDQTMAVIRCDGYGMFLKMVHPSTVALTTTEEEETYKP